MIGSSNAMQEVYRLIEQVAQSNTTVLIRGESGTGKDLVAHAVHYNSLRAEKPFIKVNCTALPETLLESELFGHEKGAFTGSLFQQRGRFERAHGGTIFLDEVCELPLHAQVRLLRVLQEKEIERVGGNQSIKIDLRIISATNKDLRKLVEQGLFRDDLYYRLCVVPIHIPPLRERKADIPALVEYFMRRKAKEIGLHFIPMLAPGTIDKLVEYDWPGNVRELSNAVERAIIIHEGAPLTVEDIVGVQTSKDGESGPRSEEKGLSLKNAEARHIRRAMELAAGIVEGPSGAAAILDMNPGTLRSKMRKLGIPFGKTANAEYRKENI
jgi:transcriptional regulator with GAF, ATPase, and Fis domain